MFGNATVLRERTRAMWSFPTLESIAQDVRYGARQLRAAPVFTSVAVLSMAAGLTAGLAVFAFMNAAMLRPLGFGEGERITAGAAAGIGAGLAGATAIQSAFPGLAALRPVVAFPVVVLYFAVAGFAAWWPARRAGSADPATALRNVG